MKKPAMAFFAAAVAAAAVFAQEPDAPAASAARTPNYEFGIGLGAAGLDRNERGGRTGFAGAFGMRFHYPNSPLDVEFRALGRYFGLDDINKTAPDPFGHGLVAAPAFHDGSLVLADLALQLVANLRRDEPVNPYVAAGGLFTSYSIDYEFGPWNSEMTFEDGRDATYVVGVGVDFRGGGLYGRAEAAFFGEVYDGGGEEFKLYGDLGCYVARSLRLDLKGIYYTGARSWAGVLGGTFAF